MKIVRDKVERTLIETAVTCQKMNVSLRCLYIRLNGLPQANLSADQQAVLDGVEACFKTHQIDAMGYIAEDGDLFFLSRQLSGKIRDDLVKTFPAHIPLPVETSLYLFEMQLEGDRVADIAREKLRVRESLEHAREAAREQAEANAKKEAQKNIEHDISTNINLIGTYDDRRAARRVPGIMIVEDDPFSQKLVTNALRDGAEVSTASSGRQAIQVMMKSAPDIIFLDIGLPDVTGLEILDEIFHVDPNAYVVMLSGNGSLDNVKVAIKKGAKDFIGKPFTVDKLHQALNKCHFIQNKRERKGMLHG